MQSALEVRREYMLSTHVRDQFSKLATDELTKAAGISKKIRLKKIKEKELPDAFLELKTIFCNAGRLFESAGRYERAAAAFTSESTYSYILGDLKDAIEVKIRASDYYLKAAQTELDPVLDNNGKIKSVYYKLSISLLKDSIKIWQDTIEAIKQKELEIAKVDSEIRNISFFGFSQDFIELKNNIQSELESVKLKLGISTVDDAEESVKKLLQKQTEIQLKLREIELQLSAIK